AKRSISSPSETARRCSCVRKDWTTRRLPTRWSCRCRRSALRWHGPGGAWSRHTSRFKARAPDARHEEHMQHIDEGTVHAWLDGALPAAEAAAVERHARDCAQCAALVADARGLIAGAARIISALDDVPGGVIPKAS